MYPNRVKKEELSHFTALARTAGGVRWWQVDGRGWVGDAVQMDLRYTAHWPYNVHCNTNTCALKYSTESNVNGDRAN